MAIKILPHVEEKQKELNMCELEALVRCQCRNVVTLLGAYHVQESDEVWVRIELE